jgi:hypothetical protein
MIQLKMGIVCITMPGLEKSVSKKIKDAYWEVELVNKLCEHLRQIGVNATLLERGSPEAAGPEWKKSVFQSGTALGCAKIEGRDIDLVQVEKRGQNPPGPGQTYLYQYVVRVNVKGLESDLKAECKPIKKRKHFRKEVVGLRWEGERLARLLNDDFNLKSMLLKEGLHSLKIRPDKRNQCVKIIPKPTGWTYTGLLSTPALGREAFPTREAFEAYDRIAQHIRSSASA